MKHKHFDEQGNFTNNINPVSTKEDFGTNPETIYLNEGSIEADMNLLPFNKKKKMLLELFKSFT